MLAEHQVDAAARLEQMLARGGGALLADAPGTGKTLVALAIARRWLARGARVEIIVPAAIRAQWLSELRDASIDDVTLLTHDGIVSSPFVATPTDRLVIVDEAHAFRNPETQRYAALARRTVAARVLLVTATPVCNRAADLRALLALIAPDDALLDAGVPSIDAAFDGRDFESITRITDSLVLRRDVHVVPEELRFGALVRRLVRYPVADASLVRGIETLAFPLIDEPHLLHRVLLFRLQSGLAAFEESVLRQQRFLDRAIDALRAGRALSRRDYRRLFAADDVDGPAQQVLFWGAFVPPGAAATVDELRSECSRLETLRRAAADLADRKLSLLVDLVRRQGQPLIVFTSFVATAKAVARAIRGSLLATGASPRGAAFALDAFVRGNADVLVTTDVAAEGLNLQRAGCVIHYDLPWNPVKLDQRNGRAHRIGQKRPSVDAYYFVPEEDLCGVMPLVATKNRLRRRIASPSLPALPGGEATMRSRLERTDAAWRLRAALKDAGLAVPAGLERRSRAGVELLLRELSNERLDRAKLCDLEQLLVMESSLTGSHGTPIISGP